ncbi:sensor histidine kinase [Gorillibacterium timonense]|uniref:sensor histidine kinase n=1 Tax=Gorillibacterium timonense TaxID=1689269 RepID=UPI0009E7FFA3|nr:HAMP domain-containing sensor histidine kinase [Gorillibacterium timonense]
MSIRTRLTLWYSFLLGAILLVFGIGLYTYISVKLYDNQDREMVGLASQLITEGRITRSVNPFTGAVGFSLPPLNYRFSTGYLAQIVDPDSGEVLTTTLPRGYELPHTKEAIEMAIKNSTYLLNEKTVTPTGVTVNWRVLNIAFSGRENPDKIIGVLQVGVQIDNTVALLKEVSQFLILLSILVIAAAASSGWYLSRKALKPIEQIILTAGRIQSSDDLGRRIEYTGPPDEVGRLTETINTMLDRVEVTYRELEESDRMQRRFVSDASHELRTPLTTIRGNVELLEKVWRQEKTAGGMTDEEKRELSLEAMADIAGEASRMSRLVNDLLALARADSGSSMQKEDVEFRSLVEDVCRKAALLPKRADWRIGDLSPLDGKVVHGNADSLRQMLFIFIENAFKYTPEGHVVLDGSYSEGQVGVRIQDTGIGMDKDEVPHIFERFYRADVSRGKTSGTGLGLSIAKWIIDQHGGSIEVTTRFGEGTSFLIWLPACGKALEVETVEPLTLTESGTERISTPDEE